MLIVLVILGLLAAVVIVFLQYVRVNARLLSRDQFETAAAKNAAKQEYRDPVITCDYCGTKFDTGKNHSCPVCGAKFDRDEEWLSRHDPDLKQAEKQADRYTKKAIKDMNRELEELRNRMKRYLKILGGSLAAMIILAVAVDRLEGDHHYVREDDKLNPYSTDSYERADYLPEGDPVLFEAMDVRISVEGFYRGYDEYSGRNKTRVGIRVENLSKDDRCVYLNCIGCDGICGYAQSDSIYNWYRGGKTVLHYLDLRSNRESIGELVFGEVRLYDNDGNTAKSDGFLRVRTTADRAPAPERPEGEVIFRDKGITVLTAPFQYDYLDEPKEGACQLYVMNETEYDFILNATDVRRNGEEIAYAPAYRDAVPAGFIFQTGMIRNRDSEEGLDGAELSLSFENAEDPSLDFSTGYFTLK